MTTHLHQLLRSLCWNTEWDYAVFWKPKHRARMVLTWEDGYYDNQYKHNPLENRSFSKSLDGLQDGRLAEDSLSVALAKMSYHVYSLGEGIVGQVAVSGKHQWIFAGEYAIESHSSLELCDGWQAQFVAGIKTVVVAAVVPFGVLQFGSLNKVNENLLHLAHIRDAFSSLQESSFHIQTPMQMPDLSSKSLGPDVLRDQLLKTASHKDNTCSSSADIPSLQEHLNDSSRVSMLNIHLKEAVGFLNKNGLPNAISNANLVLDPNHRSNISRIQNRGFNDNKQICHSSQSCLTESSTLYNSKLTALFDDGNHPSEVKIDNLENKIEILPEFDSQETSNILNSPFMLPTGTELHEALGPGFLQQCYSFPCEIENPGDFTSASQMQPKAVECSMVTSDYDTDHLLDAVVANFCHRDELKSRDTVSNSDSMMTTEKMPNLSINTSHTIGSSGYSRGCSSLLEESIQNCLNSSGSCSIRSSSSAVEPGKTNKKRARPGESSRPRPRDRQLIQDRIKELRELVPNGSKCSIDSLLERTIKHMAYMQNVTKHSDKLSKCAKSKGCSEMVALGSSYEQGSSWAVEVGGHMKICPILVENLDMNGQMLIEMLCEDCDHFLEISEAIRSLGLTILKGITDKNGDKTWMRFVVEGQSNRNLHRMDVLWSLVQILQSKTTA